MMTDQSERKPQQLNSSSYQTPVKSLNGFQKQIDAQDSKKQIRNRRSDPIKFQSLTQSSLQNPKLKLITKSKQYTVSYVYKVSSVDIIGNFEQSSNQKIRFNMSQDSPEHDHNTEKNCDLISQAKKKGIKDYTMYIRKKAPTKATIQNNSSTLNTVGYAIGTQFFKNSKLLNYFQTRIVEYSGEAPITMSIGVVNSQQALISGKNCISMGFKFTAQGNFQISRSNCKIEEDIGFKLKVDDVVGCGFIYHRNEVFFTHNGKIIYSKLKLHIPDLQEQKAPVISKLSLFDQVNQHNKKFYPYVALESSDLSLEIIFQNAYQHFMFNYAQELQKMQTKFIETEMIKNLELSEESIYGLMRNYFKFYGHQKSSLAIQAEMMKRNMKFYPQNEPIRNKLEYTKKHEIMMNQIKKMEHPNKQKRIRKRQKMKSLTQTHRHQQSESSDREPDNDHVEISVSGSDGQLIDEFYKLTRTNITVERPSSTRKDVEVDASISDQGSDSKNRKQQQGSYFINKKKMQKKVEQLKRSQEQKFKSERIQIMKNIQEGKIQQALKLFSKSFKMIFLKQKHIEVFFKAHIFLKIYDQEGLQKALQYAKAEHKTFSQYQNYLMPYFNPKSIHDKSEPECQFRPLREMLFLICLQNKNEMNFQRQLQVFADFVSTVVCEDAGFFGMSKLELVLNHYQIAEKKIIQYQIPIGGLDLENAQIV